MLARILAALPAWFTGRIGPRAVREVHSWTKNNATLRTLRYGRFRRLLIWSTDHPIVFAAMTGTAALCIAYLVAVQKWAEPWVLSAPALTSEFDIAAYAGVPWSVQATLVALVYPIVLSFIALLLQRKTHSTVALRVYVLDSAVVPAGASSIGLMVLMGAQYFATPYSTPEFLAIHMAPLLAMNGAWMFINILLTGFFLSRTIRFIQEDEQRHAFTRVAVDIALRTELTSAVKQHIFVNAAQSDWGFPDVTVIDGSAPQVHMFAVSEARPVVKRDLKGSFVLHDVHLRLLQLVATTWSRRAAKPGQAASGKTPTLVFPPRVGGVNSSEVVLCTIESGPTLNRVERLLVRIAFVYRPSRRGTLSLSTRNMLEEIGGEVEAAAEQQRFGAAEERLRDVIRLHKTLLLASAADFEAGAGNAATIGTSPYSWGESTFDMEWLKPYRDVGRIAINGLDEDARLFNTLANVPASIATALPPRPEKLLINAQLVGTNLAYQLAGWWTHKADASLAPGATDFSGTLPAPLSKVYERALISFIGSWGHFRVKVPTDFEGDDAQTWQAYTGRALVYAKHIENSSNLFLKAVSRGDEAGSVWLLDNLLKWWGNRQYDLECADMEHDFRVRHATLTLADKDWAAAQDFLWDGSEPITIEFATKALNLAIRRYWESMRLYVLLLLIQSAGSTPAVDSRELRHAATLIHGTPLRAGGSVDVQHLNSVDSVLRSLLGNVFGVETTLSRTDGFAENLRWDNNGPVVSGWTYSWSGTPTDLDSMKRAQAILLVSLASTHRSDTARSKRLIERWWRDIDKLEAVVRYCADLRSEVLSGSFSNVHGTVTVLQRLLHEPHRVRSGRLAVARALRRLQAVSRHESYITLRAYSIDPTKVRKLGQRIATSAFNMTKLPAPIGQLRFVQGMTKYPARTSFLDDKKLYLQLIPERAATDLPELVGEHVRKFLVAWSFGRLTVDAALKPVNSPALRDLYEAPRADMQEYLAAVHNLCSAFQARGDKPVVLVGSTATRTLLSPHVWGPEDWKCPLPPGIVVREAKTAGWANTVSLINEVPVFEFDTPNGDCYVLPAELLKTLEVGGIDAQEALSIEWSAQGDEKLNFNLSWHARFVVAEHQCRI